MALGLWLALAPQRPGQLWFGEPEPQASGIALLRWVGGRDLGIGLGVTATATPDSLWLRVGILADAIDGVATLLASRQMPRKSAFIGVGGAAAYSVIGTLLVRAGRGRAEAPRAEVPAAPVVRYTRA